MWIILTLLCALSQSFWMALSKRRLQTLSSIQFMLFLRLPIIALLVPIFILRKPPQMAVQFWTVVVLVSVMECVRLVAFAHGTRRDYYSTYTLLNTSPIFVLLLAPHMLEERLRVAVIAGAICVVIGGFIFYHAGRLQLAGLVAAIAQGIVTTLCKKGLSIGGPVYFMASLYTISALMLLCMEALRSGVGGTVRAYQEVAKKMLPISALNVIAIVTFMFGLNLAPATHFAVLFRTSLIFGFVLSLVLLKEYAGWRSKLAGAVFILIGSILVMLDA